ncbi:hypothetical protein PAXINDRAFT_96927 [Paxillus involutus ATCC 200175]|nr:hypothetical protein PAXINDRAFT_96927 [Paxillus involutus ATCC 200175]
MINAGKLNPAKLGNLMEIECFVLAACPENSVIEAKEFHRLTPYELEVILQAEAGNDDGNDDEDRDPDQPTFSLITGKYRYARRFGAPPPSLTTLTGLQTQWYYEGLDGRVGEDAPSILERGGILRKPRHEATQDEVCVQAKRGGALSFPLAISFARSELSLQY